MRNNTPQLQAGGTIYPSCFVKGSAAADNTCLNAATANDTCPYISQVGTKYPPGSGLGLSPGQAADAGDDIQLYGTGDVCLIYVGSGAGVTHNDLLRTDSSGHAVTVTAAGTDVVLARALATGAASTFVRCVLLTPHVYETGEA